MLKKYELVLGLLIATAIWACLFLWSQHSPQTPEVQFRQQTENTVTSEQTSKQNSTGLKNNRTGSQDNQRGDHTSEVSFIGVKPGEWLIGGITFLLWVATQMLVRDAKESSRKELRAYVHVLNIKIDNASGENGPPVIRVKFSNCGNTPAYEVQSRCSSTLGFQGGLLTESFPQKSVSYSDLGPTQSKTTLLVLGQNTWNTIFKKCINSNLGTYYVYGKITYFDTFQNRKRDKPHITRYRFQLTGIDSEGNADFLFSDEGNETT